jgi:hypothetical protein
MYDVLTPSWEGPDRDPLRNIRQSFEEFRSITRGWKRNGKIGIFQSKADLTAHTDRGIHKKQLREAAPSSAPCMHACSLRAWWRIQATCTENIIK